MIKFNPLDHPICMEYPLSIAPSEWLTHVPFGMFMIDIMRPETLVELGTNRGVSYNAFCQAVKQFGLNTHCYAVDTWEGDLHTGAYGREILEELRDFHEPLYGNFSQLVQSTFDQAVNSFPERYIDLLHIDGLHTYEAVRHDFETWLPKLSARGVVLFHDTNVRERNFGVWKLWEELAKRFPHFEFFHGHGLGVLRVGNQPTPALEPLFNMTDEEAKQFREFFFTLGSRLPLRNMNAQMEQTIQTLYAEKESAVQTISVRLASKEQEIQKLTTRMMEQNKLLQEVYGSHAWRLVMFLRRLRFWLLPRDSLREKHARLLFRGVRKAFRTTRDS